MKISELTDIGGGTPLVSPDVIVGIKVIGAPLSSFTVNSHLRNLPVKLHVSSNFSLAGATTEGEISTTPELLKLDN